MKDNGTTRVWAEDKSMRLFADDVDEFGYTITATDTTNLAVFPVHGGRAARIFDRLFTCKNPNKITQKEKGKK